MQFKMSRPESQFELFTLSLLLRLFADLFASAGFTGLRAAGTLRKENMKYDNILTILKNPTLSMLQLFWVAAELAGGCMGNGTYEWF